MAFEIPSQEPRPIAPDTSNGLASQHGHAKQLSNMSTENLT